MRSSGKVLHTLQPSTTAARMRRTTNASVVCVAGGKICLVRERGTCYYSTSARERCLRDGNICRLVYEYWSVAQQVAGSNFSKKNSCCPYSSRLCIRSLGRCEKKSLDPTSTSLKGVVDTLGTGDGSIYLSLSYLCVSSNTPTAVSTGHDTSTFCDGERGGQAKNWKILETPGIGPFRGRQSSKTSGVITLDCESLERPRSTYT